MAKWNLDGLTPKEPSDGRPCNTDVFLVHLLEHEHDNYDLRDRIQDWIEGDWDGALKGLPPMEVS